jgi:hypothetical protein
MSLCCVLSIILCAILWPGKVLAQDAFIELPGTHFIVRYVLPYQRSEAAGILARAEECYSRVSRDIGFSRYTDFWTWDKRVRIILFPDQTGYARFTGQSQWSKGYASRNSLFFRDRVIVTYSGQGEMASAILPHEIAHLVLWDLLGDRADRVPVWFEEGVAQLEEQGSRQAVQSAVVPMVAAGRQIPFEVFNGLTPSELKDDAQVAVFYAQSLSVVVFLIEKYGQDAFYRLSKELGAGMGLEAALVKVYRGVFGSMRDLETRWVGYISGL